MSKPHIYIASPITSVEYEALFRSMATERLLKEHGWPTINPAYSVLLDSGITYCLSCNLQTPYDDQRNRCVRCGGLLRDIEPLKNHDWLQDDFDLLNSIINQTRAFTAYSGFYNEYLIIAMHNSAVFRRIEEGSKPAIIKEWLSKGCEKEYLWADRHNVRVIWYTSPEELLQELEAL